MSASSALTLTILNQGTQQLAFTDMTVQTVCAQVSTPDESQSRCLTDCPTTTNLLLLAGSDSRAMN